MAEKVTHGRGGAGNIGPDRAPYGDGEIVRTGPAGDQGDGPFSVGRGGSGNIGAKASPLSPPSQAHDKDVIPSSATRVEKQQPHHVGRGGAGNETHVHKEREEQHGADQKTKHEEGLVDKIKQKITETIHHDKGH